MHTHRHHGVDPEQSLPAGDLDEHAAQQRTRGGTDGRRGTPQRHRAQLSLPAVGDRQQAQAAGQDGRPGRALDHPAGDHHARRSRTSAISTHDTTNSSRPSWKTRLRPKTSPSEPEVMITAAPTSE